jgi:hypothetical protein
MQELSWINYLPGESLEGGIALLNRLLWNIRYGPARRGGWAVHAGHCLIFKSDSKDSVEAFLYGMALSYSVMQADLLEAHRRNMFKEAGLDPDKPQPD